MIKHFILGILWILAGSPGHAQAKANTVSIAVISDLNGPYGSPSYNAEVHTAVRAIQIKQPDFVLSTGDMIAGQKASLTDAQVNAMWEGFHKAVTIPLMEAGLKLGVTPGNHDASGYAGYERDRRIFSEQWGPGGFQFGSLALSGRAKDRGTDLSHYPFYYSVGMGNLKILSLDLTKVGPLDSIQRNWLESNISRNPEMVTIVFGHVPLFPVAQNRETDAMFDLKLENFLSTHNVALVLSGHHHAYYPAKRGNLRLVHTACLGDGARKWIGDERTSPKGFLWIEIDEKSGEISMLEQLEAPDFTNVTPRATLPPKINPKTPYELTRDDL